MPETKQKYLIVSDENQQRIVSILKRLVAHRKAETLKSFLLQIHPTELANLWHGFDETEQDIIITLLTPEYSAEFLSELEAPEREEIFRSKDTEWIVDRLEELESDDIVDILKGLSTWEANFIIKRFDQDYSAKIKELLKYPEETAGALMTSDFLAVSQGAKIENIIKTFRKVIEKDQINDVHFVYVTDKQSKLQGYIPIRALILEKPSAKARDVMLPPPVTLNPTMDQEEVAKIFKDFNLISAPVVNEDGILLGRITVDDIVDVLDEEASEDVFMMMGVGKDEKMSNNIFTSFRHRLPWMLINLGTSSLSVAVISFFTTALQKNILLAIFMPMVAPLGGATGNQMVAIIVRGLALGELHWGQVRWVLFREVSAVALGAIVVGAIITTISYYSNIDMHVGIIVAVSLLLNMVLATLIGAGIPLILKLLRFDPALGSSILVAATTDVMGFFIFLGLATWFLLQN